MNMNKEHPVEICSCAATGKRKNECFVFIDSTRRICKKEKCELEYKCVRERKKGLKCERKAKTHLVVPDGGNTCKVLIVDKHEYVPFAVY